MRLAQCSGLPSHPATTSSAVMTPLARFSPTSLQWYALRRGTAIASGVIHVAPGRHLARVGERHLREFLAHREWRRWRVGRGPAAARVRTCLVGELQHPAADLAEITVRGRNEGRGERDPHLGPAAPRAHFAKCGIDDLLAELL